MKKLIVLLFAVILVGCDVHGENDPLDLRLVFDAYPPDQVVTGYQIYWWQGDDTTGWNPTDLTLISTEAFVQGDSVVSLPYTVTFNFVVAGARARNIVGWSDMGYTEIHSYFEFMPPSRPLSPRIIR